MKRSSSVAGAAALGLVVLAGGVGLASADGLDGTSPVRAARMLHDASAAHAVVVTSEAGYLAQMVPHHEEAVRAARHLSRSARPEMRRLGEAVVRVQSAEIAAMEGWLARWYPAQPAAPSAPGMRDLSGLQGDALDRAFLEDMVPHHMTAVMTSRQLAARGLVEHPEVGAFARGVVTSQHAEIVQMRQWLAAWFGVRTGMRWGGAPGHGTWMAPGAGMPMAPGDGMRMAPGDGMRMGPARHG